MDKKKINLLLGLFTAALGIGLIIYFYLQYSFVKTFETKSDRPLLKEMPAFTVTKLDSNEIIDKQSLYRTAPQLVMVHFWATWCAPCLTEFPQLMAKLEGMKDSKGFTVVLIAINENSQDIHKFLEKKSIKIPPNVIMAIDEKGKSQFDFGTVKIPETYLFNAKGVTVEKFIGPQAWEDRFFADKIQTNLPTSP
ncbi:MAG: TlpA family protein disulfide reductase [Bdellovibrio sp.]|nr:TlpA family protein disulfide reductase [Bdellovibrio sp.]